MQAVGQLSVRHDVHVKARCSRVSPSHHSVRQFLRWPVQIPALPTSGRYWSELQDKARRRLVIRSAAKPEGESSDEDVPFWEGEEGQKKWDEIEELKQIVRQRKLLEAQMAGDKADSSDSEDGLTSEERARQTAEQLREMLAKVRLGCHSSKTFHNDGAGTGD